MEMGLEEKGHTFLHRPGVQVQVQVWREKQV